MELNRTEVIALMGLLGTVEIGQIDTPVKRALLSKLFAASTVTTGVTSVMLINVAPGDAVGAIKTIRGLTGLGLKEAKDTYGAIDPDRAGGTIGPIPISVPYEQALANLRGNFLKYQYVTHRAGRIILSFGSDPDADVRRAIVMCAAL